MEDPHTLTSLLHRASAKFPTLRALSVSGGIDLSHAHLHDLIERAALRLYESGVLPGHVVSLTLPNTIEFVIAFLAVIRTRATAVPLNPAYTQDEFEFYLSDSESTILLISPEGNKPAESAAAKLNIPHATVALSDGAEPEFTIFSTRTYQIPVNNPVNEPSDIALFLHTSGTTSRPKGVPLTQQNLMSAVKNIASVYELTESDSTVIVLPLFHVHGLLAGLLSSLSVGASVALPSSGRFSASTFWSDMVRYDATWYTAVPTIHQILLDRHVTRPESSYPTLRFVRSCSASLAPAILTRLEEAFGTPVLESYAMTETTHLMCSNPLLKNGPHKPGSVGRPVGQELAILDERGVSLGANARGEICVRGENVTKGYKNNPDANKNAFSYGWFHTGDIGFCDSDGYLHLVGRIKELINRGGEKISPIEVDAILLSHPDITQAVSFGVPDMKYGEEIHCAIITRDGTDIDEEEVLRFCKKNLAAFKVPKKVFITDSVPKTATGKIQRRLVAEHFLARVSTAKA